jgi:hypothetical protein
MDGDIDLKETLNPVSRSSGKRVNRGTPRVRGSCGKKREQQNRRSGGQQDEKEYFEYVDDRRTLHASIE